ncbi:hypothetical protein M430DRAFT_267389 [Amorphotheca resinae ATCC 22711]|jgi:hypothetical protein|uniref:Uncharacterized protein n=1 Tax=Amorphotheca resinae ATCC 22711 TaxID=857342 RepID=A0A2T3AX83_AMORE|nr:hypothetical protein M430DRAFT_267389 [Amorphotheca resinae ATCC 22711]PSS13286.1 hypothetical protein M430DRAFT_267389 [Amorphotheca resinae ATCC 22711]
MGPSGRLLIRCSGGDINPPRLRPALDRTEYARRWCGGGSGYGFLGPSGSNSGLSRCHQRFQRFQRTYKREIVTAGGVVGFAMALVQYLLLMSVPFQGTAFPLSPPFVRGERKHSATTKSALLQGNADAPRNININRPRTSTCSVSRPSLSRASPRRSWAVSKE